MKCSIPYRVSGMHRPELETYLAGIESYVAGIDFDCDRRDGIDGKVYVSAQ